MPTRLKLTISGIVQGVGFRPFVYRLASGRGLAGFIRNTADGVWIEAQGEEEKLQAFLDDVLKNKPPSALIAKTDITRILPVDDETFSVLDSGGSHCPSPVIPPDFSVCNECTAELFSSVNRRYRYPFISCTNCGPRFTITQHPPFDRPRTTMSDFTMCRDCLDEYNNPEDRRFHSQINACPACGPGIYWTDKDNGAILTGEDAIKRCEEIILSGSIAAIKGIGGFHLMADARNDNAILRLRRGKMRDAKPFAIMFPEDETLAFIKKEAVLSAAEEAELRAGARPIVILKKRKDSEISALASPGLDTLGAFLPYSPLHHILLSDLKMPIVATSANAGDAPIIIDNKEAVEQVKDMAEGLLMHDRDILRRCDDSVAAMSGSRKIFFRRSRGYAPDVFKLPYKLKQPLLAVGGNQKVAAALGWEDNVVMSQHIGDLASRNGCLAFEETIADMTAFYRVKPLSIACDMHPDYISTKWALAQKQTAVIKVQHHHAHIVSCMLDNGLLNENVLGIAWDGAGFGTDKTIWGGEFMIADCNDFERFCSFRQFRLPGGENAVREPRRSLLAILHEIHGNDAADKCPFLKNIFTESELRPLLKMLGSGFNSPMTSSAGRLFDAAASLLDICQNASYEGHGAMMLEAEAGSGTGDAYPICVTNSNGIEVFDWAPMFNCMIEGIGAGISASTISRNFHETLARLILHVSQTARRKKGITAVCLSGGVFQNMILSERAISLLKENGFNAMTHNRIPPNDGGISPGQLIIADSKFD